MQLIRPGIKYLNCLISVYLVFCYIPYQRMLISSHSTLIKLFTSKTVYTISIFRNKSNRTRNKVERSLFFQIVKSCFPRLITLQYICPHKFKIFITLSHPWMYKRFWCIYTYSPILRTTHLFTSKIIIRLTSHSDYKFPSLHDILMCYVSKIIFFSI